MESQIERIKANLSVLEAWRILDLPGEPHIGDQRSPFRKDKRASFTIFRINGATKWFDHGIGEGGDSIDLWRAASGLSSAKEAIVDILQRIPALNVSEPILERFSKPEPILWPDNLQKPTEAECRTLGKLRGLSPEAFFLAGQLGTLLTGDKRGQRIWMTCDRKRRTAAMRRIDGLNLDLINKKSASPKNAKRDWIIGTQTSNPCLDELKNIILVEGEGDYYAALQLSITSEVNFKVLAILGANQKTFHEDCQAQFIHASVLILPHNDRTKVGEEAAKKWTTLSYCWGASKVAIQPLPVVCDDLNDFLIQRPSDGHKLLRDFHDGSIRRQR
jgi:hypothetical protein